MGTTRGKLRRSKEQKLEARSQKSETRDEPFDKLRVTSIVSW